MRRPLRSRLALAALALAPALAACFADEDEAVLARGEAVGRLVVERLSENKELETVRLGELSPFRWERLYVFAPGTAPQTIVDSLGRPWPLAERTGIAVLDTANLLVFTAGGEVIAATMHPKRYGDFAPALTGRGYAPDEAVFRVERTAENTPYFTAGK